jgi:hypothetical protein
VLISAGAAGLLDNDTTVALKAQLNQMARDALFGNVATAAGAAAGGATAAAAGATAAAGGATAAAGGDAHDGAVGGAAAFARAVDNSVDSEEEYTRVGSGHASPYISAEEYQDAQAVEDYWADADAQATAAGY